MTAVPTYNFILNKVDSLTRLTDSVLSVQLMQNAKMDSVCDIVSQLSETQIALQSQTETVSDQIQKISEYGIGYSDVVAHITIPLVIALFAFAMPLLFQVITHINSKYTSEPISKMFESCLPYKSYWVVSVFSVLFLILFGVVSFVVAGEVRGPMMMVLNWASLFVALVYSTAILVFLKTCIRFNSPDKLLAMISEQYQAELRYDDMKLAFKKIARLRDKAQFWRSKGWKSFREFTFRSFNLFHHYQARTDYGNRLVDLCKYALNTRNNTLLFSIMIKLDGITASEKHFGFIPPSFNLKSFKDTSILPFTKAFYEGIMDYYSHAEENRQFEEWIIRRKFSAFKESRFPWEREYVDTIRTVIQSVEAGHLGIYEKYLDTSGFQYLFIKELSNRAYIEGADETSQKAVDNKVRETWERLSDIHFIMNAYLYSRGYLELLPALLDANYYRTGHLYDMLPHEILLRYLRCKREFRSDGGYWYWNAKDIFGRDKVDGEMLEKFTAAMMILNSAVKVEGPLHTSKVNLEDIEKYKKVLVKYMDEQKDDKYLREKYPFIEKVKSTTIINGCTKLFKSKGTDIFDADIPKAQKELLINDLLNVYRNTGWMPKGLKETGAKGVAERNQLQAYTVLMNKNFVCQYNDDDSFHMQRHYEIVFEQRAIYMIYSAISKMKLKRRKVRAGDFESFMKKYTNGKNDEYIIIDTDCDLDILLDIDNRDTYGEWDYKGAEYKKMFLDAREYLRDVDLPIIFKNSLLILRKEDYPSLFKINEDVMPQVIIADESDRDSGRAAVRVTVMPNLEMRYYKNSKVLWVELTR